MTHFAPIALLLLFATGCRRGIEHEPSTTPPQVAPVLLVGMDGLEWDLVLELVDQGRLPHLAALMERGVYGELKTLVPTLSPNI